ncbi:RapZ C-terminal domain-containing protein [Umezawaea beigongshangensis]|uniref:RapZ C-terminal domain-containing protein n=1 Tax=Umezawaea beigongshangensis TaxID=2780383 RepID=UPI0018F26718|nr:RNase adapter RapZ [Umezawaea beigongshangensis]
MHHIVPASPTPVRVLSFGYLHSTPPAAELVLDVRRYLSDPARVRDTGLLDSDGRDPAVQDAVIATPGSLATLLALRIFTDGYPAHKPLTIAIGCAGGRHRSAALAELLTSELLADGIPAQVHHLHIHLPRVLHDTDDTAPTQQEGHPR